MTDKKQYHVYEVDDHALYQKLREILCKKSTVIACVGTELRSDDKAGIILYNMLIHSLENLDNVVLCEYGIENCLGEIEEKKPETLVIIDGIVANAPPGAIVIAPLETIDESFLATTHNIPLSLSIKFLRSMGLAKEVIIIGVRVQSLELGEEISPVVEKATRRLASKISMVIRECMKQNV